MASTLERNRVARCGGREKRNKKTRSSTGLRPEGQILQPARVTCAWQPAINAYRCDTCIRICVDLAGVDRSLIDLSVEPRRLVIRGTRELPEPTGDEGCAKQLLAMEIDYGPFERELTFPVDVEIDQAHAEQRNGLLWISLPVRKES